MASREINVGENHGQVADSIENRYGQTVQADTVNQLITGNRALTRHERKEINDRIRDLCNRFDQAPWDTWRTLHRVCGVEDVEQMHLGHLEPVRMILVLLGRALGAEAVAGYEPIAIEPDEPSLAALDYLAVSDIEAQLRSRIAQLEKQLRGEKAQTARLVGMQDKLLAESGRCASCQALAEKRRNWQRLIYVVTLLVLIVGVVIGSHFNAAA